MQHNTDNLRITSSAPMIAPNELMEKYPLGEKGSANIFQARQAVKDILEGKDHRLMVIVGPCSIHDSKSAREYADKLAKVKEELKQDLLIVIDRKSVV